MPLLTKIKGEKGPFIRQLPAPESSTKLAVRMLLPRWARSTRRCPRPPLGAAQVRARRQPPAPGRDGAAATPPAPGGSRRALRDTRAPSYEHLRQAAWHHIVIIFRAGGRGKQDGRTYLRATTTKHGYALLRRGGAPAASPPPAAGRSEAAPCGSGQRPRLAPGPRDAAATHGPHQPPPASWRPI